MRKNIRENMITKEREYKIENMKRKKNREYEKKKKKEKREKNFKD